MSYPEPRFEVATGLWLFSSLRKYVILLVASNVALCVRLEGNKSLMWMGGRATPPYFNKSLTEWQPVST